MLLLPPLLLSLLLLLLLWSYRTHCVRKQYKVLFFHKMLLVVSCLSGEVSEDSEDSFV